MFFYLEVLSSGHMFLDPYNIRMLTLFIFWFTVFILFINDFIYNLLQLSHLRSNSNVSEFVYFKKYFFKILMWHEKKVRNMRPYVRTDTLIIILRKFDGSYWSWSIYVHTVHKCKFKLNLKFNSFFESTNNIEKVISRSIVTKFLTWMFKSNKVPVRYRTKKNVSGKEGHIASGHIASGFCIGRVEISTILFFPTGQTSIIFFRS